VAIRSKGSAARRSVRGRRTMSLSSCSRLGGMESMELNLRANNFAAENCRKKASNEAEGAKEDAEEEKEKAQEEAEEK